MKKKLKDNTPGKTFPGAAKILLKMKLTLCVILISILGGMASESYSQTTKLSLDLKNAKVKDALGAIENQSEFFFLYSEKLIDVNREVNIEVQGSAIEKILDKIFEGTNVNYTVKGRQIVLTTPEANNEAGMSSVSQQQKKVTGKVTDSSGASLPGVSVVVKGTTTGVITDNRGNYSLSNIPENATLQFSFVGMKTQEVILGNQTTLKIVLVDETIGLEEVVAIGYGTQRKVEVTSAVASVKSDNFIKGSVKDAGQLLQGKVAGLTIITPSGDPLASSQVLLRGTATLSTSTQPLIIVDGIPGNMSTVAPEDIESIDVLKDGSAAAIYGTRGTNGVILITTKKPNGNIEPSITYNGYFSSQAYVRIPKMLDAAGYREKLAQGVAFADLGSTTDWVKEISRKNPISHNQNITLRGGNAKTNYLGTLNYRQLEGVMLKSDYRTINSRIDLNHNMFDDKLKININIINNDNKTGVPFSQLGGGLSSESSNVFNQALYRNPTAPIKNSDGNWNEETSISYYENPLGLLNETYGNSQSQMTRIGGTVTFEPFKDLRFKALGSRSKTNSESGLAQTKKHISTIRDGYNGYATKSAGQSSSNLLELTTEYTKMFYSHKFTALAGYSYQDNVWESSSMRNWNFPAGNFSYIDNIGIGQRAGIGGTNMMSSSKYESNLIGFFGRLGYNFKEKYLLAASFRYEASSKFLGAKQPWGNFPSISAGWRISEEEFMRGFGFLNNLKLRAGYGITGTAPDELFLGVSLLGYQGSSLINGQWLPSLSPKSNPNPSLRWEEKKEANLGLDFGILEGRISGSIDYYNRTTDGLLYDYSVPTPPNAYGTTKANVGIMENKGLEMVLNVIIVKNSKFTWNSDVTFSTNTNKLVSLSNELYSTTNPWFDAGYTGSPVQTFTHRIEVGKPIGNFYGYKVIDITDAGKWIYENADGIPSETRVQKDKKILGNGLPKYYASWNNSIRYRNLDLNVTMRGAFGYQILNYQRMYSENPGFTSYNLLNSAFDKVFNKSVLNKTVPVEFNSYYIENGNFWKIDNITLGYNLGKSKIKHIGSARLYLSVLNAFTFTGYKGMDPEVGALGLTPGNDYRNKYPTTRTYSIGCNITIN